ncbi:MAG TPA: autotransporter domain-containing protein, partial [Alphaproteobacteria bacterium]
MGLTTDSYTLTATTITVNAGSMLSATGSSTVTGAISLAAGATLSSADGSFILGDITGEGGVQTIQLLNGETLGQAGDAIDLAGGNDVITIDGGSTIDADTLDMGAGTDTMNVNNDTTVTSDVLNTESVLIDTGITLTLRGNMTGGTITVGDTGNLIIDSSGNAVTSTITGLTGGGEAQTMRMTDGTLSGAVNLGDGNDQVIYDAGTISNTVNMGTGTDSLTVNGSLTMAAAWSGLEAANLNGNILTINAALTGVSDGFGTGVDVNGGTVNINGGASVDGGIYSSNGAGDGNLVFGTNTLGGTFNLGGVVNDVGVTVTSGTVNTNGFSMGADELLGDIFVDTGAMFSMADSVSSGGNLLNDGDIRIGAGDVLTAVTTGAGAGEFTFVVNGAGAGEFGSLVVSGGAFDMSAATVDIDASAGSFIDGDEIQLVNGAATIIGGPGAVAAALTENYFMWDFALVDGTVVTAATDDTDLFLIVSRAPGAAAVAGGNNAGAAEALIALSGTSDPDLQDVLAQMNNATSAEQASEVFESVSPTVDAGQTTAVMDFSAATFDVVSTHIEGTEIARVETPESGMAAGGAYKNLKVWGQTFAKQSDQDSRGGVDGYESAGWGGIVGVETENLHDDALVGVAFGYGSTDVNSDNANRTGTDIDSYQGAVYGRYNFDENQYVTAMAGYARSNLETTRYNVGTVPGLNAHGDFSADQYSASVEAGRKYKMDGFLLQPNLNSRWVHYAADGYSETGAGGAGLRVEESDMDQLTVGAGMNVAWGGEYDDGSYIIPGVHFGYKYDVIGDSIETTSAFNAGGPSFKTEGAEPVRSTGNVGASLTLISVSGIELKAAYDFEFKSDYEAHSGYIRASARF